MPGFSTDSCLRFPGKGNEGPSTPASALVVKFAVEYGDTTGFMIKGSNLEYTHKMDLADAILNKPM